MTRSSAVRYNATQPQCVHRHTGETPFKEFMSHGELVVFALLSMSWSVGLQRKGDFYFHLEDGHPSHSLKSRERKARVQCLKYTSRCSSEGSHANQLSLFPGCSVWAVALVGQHEACLPFTAPH